MRVTLIGCTFRLPDSRKETVMSWKKIQGIVRHALTFGGGYLAAQGWVAEGMVPEIVGALMTLIGLVWSIAAPEKKDA